MRRLLVALTLVAMVAALTGAANGSPNFRADLSGANEVPTPVVSDTSGSAKFKVNRDYTEIRYSLKIKDASGIIGAAGAHLHCAPTGSNGPVVAFLAGVVPGGLDGRVEVKATLTDANIVNPACGATIHGLVQSFRDGNVYVNVHSIANPAGEVRGQVG